jgi:hypothetical protein
MELEPGRRKDLKFLFVNLADAAELPLHSLPHACDRSVLAAILCGSLSHDTVWAKSDIDLVLVTIDDKKPGKEGLALYADGINVHALLMPRAEFRKTVEGSIRNSFQHSFLAKGRLLYTHDETIAALCEQLQSIGERDIQVQLLERREPRAGADLQGSQMVHHARRPGIHGALDSVRGHSAGKRSRC